MRYGRGLAAILIVMIAGCTAQQLHDFQASFYEPAAKAATPPTLTPAQRTLTMGVWMYEDGDYGGAENYLKSALSQDTTEAERVRAHQECRREFREALAIDPRFQLTPAEQGHPTWGPVFRSLKPMTTGGR